MRRKQKGGGVQGKPRRVVLTGGHAGTTAIATVEAYMKLPEAKKREIHWIGPKRVFEGSRKLSFEFKVMPELGVTCHGIIAGKVQSKFTRYTILAGLKIPVGFFHGLYLVAKIRPEVVLSFGGFAAVPVVFAAWVLGVPVVIHEQIAAAGLGNRLSAPLAKKIAVARKDSFEFFPKGKTILVGNPILAEIAKLVPKKEMAKPPVLYIQGGSRGAVRINRLVEKVLPSLLGDYGVIHQTGEVDIERYEALRRKLPEGLRRRYRCFSFCSPFEVYKLYAEADVVIGRAGANTVSEVLAAGRPAIYIPIPWSIFNEQVRNAQYAQRVGMARIIEEKDLTPERFGGEIRKVVHDWREMSRKGYSPKATVDEQAAAKLVELVEEELL